MFQPISHIISDLRADLRALDELRANFANGLRRSEEGFQIQQGPVEPRGLRLHPVAQQNPFTSLSALCPMPQSTSSEAPWLVIVGPQQDIAAGTTSPHSRESSASLSPARPSPSSLLPCSLSLELNQICEAMSALDQQLTCGESMIPGTQEPFTATSSKGDNEGSGLEEGRPGGRETQGSIKKDWDTFSSGPSRPHDITADLVKAPRIVNEHPHHPHRSSAAIVTNSSRATSPDQWLQRRGASLPTLPHGVSPTIKGELQHQRPSLARPPGPHEAEGLHSRELKTSCPPSGNPSMSESSVGLLGGDLEVGSGVVSGSPGGGPHSSTHSSALELEDLSVEGIRTRLERRRSRMSSVLMARSPSGV